MSELKTAARASCDMRLREAVQNFRAVATKPDTNCYAVSLSRRQLSVWPPRPTPRCTPSELTLMHTPFVEIGCTGS